MSGESTTSTGFSALQQLLSTFRAAAHTEREKGTYFEDLILKYFQAEPDYRVRYSNAWTYADWTKEDGRIYDRDATDDGIDLVAKTRGTNEYHAIQCKFYAEDHIISKSDIDSFFTASGQQPFTHRIIVSTTDRWNDKAHKSLQAQQPPVSKISRTHLENSLIDWSQFEADQAPVLKERKCLRPHQQTALKAVCAGLAEADRGKMIHACGTGKTFTSLKIAEKMAGQGKRVLFMAPSLALLSQTITEYTQQSKVSIHAYAVCSDSQVGKRRQNRNEDAADILTHELNYPATTRADKLAAEMIRRHDDTHMSVVFSTYHSIEVLHKAQTEHGLEKFDLIICDEAHRTTGATFDEQPESHFVRIHDAQYIQGSKRLYMTATPRIYGDEPKQKAREGAVVLCSMDDENLYGRDLDVLNFSTAVEKKLLVDYKVIVLRLEEADISRSLQHILSDGSNALRVSDAAKIVGTYKALSMQDHSAWLTDRSPLKRAVAFCQVIEHNPDQNRHHKVSSKHMADMYESVVKAYQEAEEPGTDMVCEVRHVDGSMNAGEKEEKLTWLKSEPSSKHCRILTNVRCLSEGVDVPALDAVLFLTPRNSQVDVVQSVGRVMRKAPGKKLGYVVLPVVIPAGVEAAAALNDTYYKTVWQVLGALRAHDDRFDAHINRIKFDGIDPNRIEVISVVGQVARKQAADPRSQSTTIGQPEALIPLPIQQEIGAEYQVGVVERAIYAAIVKKCGNREYWDEWASDVAGIAQTHITRIRSIVDNPANGREVAIFGKFADELRDDLNENQAQTFPVIPTLGEKERNGTRYTWIYPNLTFAASMDCMWIYHVYPITSKSTRVVQTVCFPPEITQRDDFGEKSEMYYQRFDFAIDEDIPALERQQAGMQSPYAVQGRISALEPCVGNFACWYSQATRNQHP